MADPANHAPFERGHVVWHDSHFRESGRPWLVLSDGRHPFHGREYLVCGITTTDREPAIRLTDDVWLAGGLPRTSYASPWFLSTLKHGRIERGVGALGADVVERIVGEAAAYLGAA